MSNREVSFSRDFRQQYDELDKVEQDAIQKVLASLIPILKEMKRTEFHFNRNMIRFDVGGTLGTLHVSIYDNPLQAIVKKHKKKVP